MVKEMCKAAGVEGNKTNHSLRCCRVTSLYKSNVPEKLIQERSGHRSLTALRVYERPTAEQILETSKVLLPPTDKQSNQKAPSLVQHPMKEVVQTVAIHPSLPTNLFSSCSINSFVIQIQVCELSSSAICSRNTSNTKAFLEELEDIDMDEFFKDS